MILSAHIQSRALRSDRLPSQAVRPHKTDRAHAAVTPQGVLGGRVALLDYRAGSDPPHVSGDRRVPPRQNGFPLKFGERKILSYSTRHPRISLMRTHRFDFDVADADDWLTGRAACKLAGCVSSSLLRAAVVGLIRVRLTPGQPPRYNRGDVVQYGRRKATAEPSPDGQTSSDSDVTAESRGDVKNKTTDRGSRQANPRSGAGKH